MNDSRASIAALLFLLGLEATARADLDGYVKAADPSFVWKVEATKDVPGGKATQIALTSQTWRGIVWMHKLQIYEPAEVKYPDVMLVFITGGANKADIPAFKDAESGMAFAKVCGARVAVLPQVPNQPLMGGRTEDDLIAQTFVEYLKDGDETWPLLFPMVKSAVRAMDATQAWAKDNGRPVPSKFVVSGASKRGWTTWLTGAEDPRVIAIAPMVIPTLNMRAQNHHQLEVWGRYSEQIDDYVRRGLMEKIDTPEGTKLWKMIDPYTYRDRLTMPKLQINGTNDPYWTLDSMNLYWDDLKGPKYVVYLPNAGHDLKEHRDYAVNGVGALFRHAASGRKIPEFSWAFERDAEGVNVRISHKEANARPKTIQLWIAKSDTKEFRTSHWEATPPPPIPITDEESLSVSVFPDFRGFTAVFADLTFEIDGLEYHLSSQIGIFGPKGEKR